MKSAIIILTSVLVLGRVAAQEIASITPSNPGNKFVKKNISQFFSTDEAIAYEYVKTGMLREGEKDYHGAYSSYSQAIEANPKYAVAYERRGLLLANMYKFIEALDDFSKAIELNQNEPDFYIFRANIYVEINNYKRALNDYNKAVELRSNYGAAYYYRGMAKFIYQDEIGSYLDFREAFNLNHPHSADALEYFGLIPTRRLQQQE